MVPPVVVLEADPSPAIQFEGRPRVGRPSFIVGPGCAAALREELGVQYGSAPDFAGQQQALELDLHRPPERRKPRAVVRRELSTLVGGDHYVPYTRFDEVVQITADWIRDRP